MPDMRKRRAFRKLALEKNCIQNVAAIIFFSSAFAASFPGGKIDPSDCWRSKFSFKYQHPFLLLLQTLLSLELVQYY